MCGLACYAAAGPVEANRLVFQRLWYQSRVRGLHAFGMMWGGREFGVLSKRAFEMDALLYNAETLGDGFILPNFMVGHCRYDTSGDWRKLENNQPLHIGDHFSDMKVLAYNGVISMGTKAEYEAEFGVQCVADNDGEVLLRRMEQGQDPAEFVMSIRGSFAGFIFDGSANQLLALRNERRPLWVAHAPGQGAAWYSASTQDIFRRAHVPYEEGSLRQLEPGEKFVLWDGTL